MASMWNKQELKLLKNDK